LAVDRAVVASGDNFFVRNIESHFCWHNAGNLPSTLRSAIASVRPNVEVKVELNDVVVSVVFNPVPCVSCVGPIGLLEISLWYVSFTPPSNKVGLEVFGSGRHFEVRFNVTRLGLVQLDLSGFCGAPFGGSST
jgi:hypothetical protein